MIHENSVSISWLRVHVFIQKVDQSSWVILMPRLVLILLVAEAKHCCWLVEQPTGSSDTLPYHPRLDWMINQVIWVTSLQECWFMVSWKLQPFDITFIPGIQNWFLDAPLWGLFSQTNDGVVVKWGYHSKVGAVLSLNGFHFDTSHNM